MSQSWESKVYPLISIATSSYISWFNALQEAYLIAIDNFAAMVKEAPDVLKSLYHGSFIVHNEAIAQQIPNMSLPWPMEDINKLRAVATTTEKTVDVFVALYEVTFPT